MSDQHGGAAMNRRQRRAEARKAKSATTRHAAIQNTLAYLAGCGDPTISGATLILPGGEMLHLSADTARAMHRKDKQDPKRRQH